MVTIWFNRSYATTAHMFPLLRNNPDGEAVRLVATHPDPTSPVLATADVALPEPTGLDAGAYVAWALATCAEQGVDVLVPREHLLAIAETRADFEAAGVAVAVGPAPAVRLLGDKAAAYADATAAGLAVPPHRVVRTAAELEAAREELAGEGELCIKPVEGVGAAGYRRVVDRPLAWDDLLEPVAPDVRWTDLLAALREAGTVPAMMLMPFLTGPEISVDCLGDVDGRLVAAVPRAKAGRQRSLVDDPAAVEVARTIVARHRLRSLSNTQVRWWQRPGVDAAPLPYLLETNTRAAGGLFQTALSGANLIWSAVREARGLDPQVTTPTLGIPYTTLSTLAPRPTPTG